MARATPTAMQSLGTPFLCRWLFSQNIFTPRSFAGMKDAC